MKVCLINPPWFTKKGNIWSQIRSTFPPLGLLYLASFLERENIEVDVIDFQASFQSWEDAERVITTRHYDFYGITATTPTVYSGYRIARIIKTHYPDTKVIFGGVHVTALPEEALSEESIDFVIRGEGEGALLKLIRGAPFESIAGLSYKEKGNPRHIEPDGLVHDLDSIPFPAFHKVNLKLYHPAIGSYCRLPAINMLTSRGCVGKCTFCNSANIPLRVRSAENIFEEIRVLYKNYGIKEISFYDDTFTVHRKNVEKLCDLLIGNKIDISWCCFTRADCITFPLLKRMKAAGCHQVMYGIEAASTEILKNIKKVIDYNENKMALELTKKAGIKVRCTFMLGNPGETIETINDTIRYSIQLDPDIALYNITMPYPGTEMFSWAKQNGYLLHERWDEYDLSYPVMKLPSISTELLAKKYKQAFRDFYLRPSFVFKKLIDIVLLKDASRLIDAAMRIYDFMKS
jgi:anaerobic magnesium-protoporphyrin IX monomethyl ester cyclase